MTANPDLWAPFLASVDALTRGERRRLLTFLENAVTAASGEIPQSPAAGNAPVAGAAPSDNRYQIATAQIAQSTAAPTVDNPQSPAAPSDNRYQSTPAATANRLQSDALDVDPADWLPVVCPHCDEARSICLEMAGVVWVFQCVACGEVFELRARKG